MRVYIVTYRCMADKKRGIYVGEKISQEGYETLEKAQQYIKSRPDHPVKVTEMYFTADNAGEYYIHDIMIMGVRMK